MQKTDRFRIHADYRIVLCICVSFMILALVFDTPAEIMDGYQKLSFSRSVLVTDYIALSGIGAALTNSAVSGLFFLLLLVLCRREPDGTIIASLWITMGFSLFGKNFFNTLPLLIGVMLYARVRKKRLSELLSLAMLSATIAPIVSEIAFLNEVFSPIRIAVAYGVGVFVGFIFPTVTAAAKRMHQGYCLYNSGIAGGFIATFSVGMLRSAGIDIVPEHIWDTAHTPQLAAFSYALGAALIGYGVISDGPVRNVQKFMLLLKEKDKDDNDYLIKYGGACYTNIGVMCVVATSTVLLLRIPINGPVLGGIFTVSGFAASGKHLLNTVPVLLGSVIATHVNDFSQAAPANALAILFSTGLAPICGAHGWRWGVVVGFLHVAVAIFIGQLNGGLNLYNNGFAGGFVAITIVPLIVFAQETTRQRAKRE